MAVIAVAGSAEIKIDDAIPAGNVIVKKIEGDTVFLKQDLRDTKGDWFYWAFRVTGAAGRTVKFEFPEGKPAGGPVGVRGPVVSKDRGKTFSFPLDGKSDKASFTYTFAADENETWFYECHPYVRADWDAFVKRHEAFLGRVFVVETLCRSRKGADVPRARFGCISETPKHRVFVSARHHCSESMASWVLEGIGEAFFAKNALGVWLRENVELMMVPMTDYDGVQAGDQGKNRAPHDHNRDYAQFLYPETAAIRDWIAEHAKGRLDMFIDVHCPGIRGKYNEFVYTPWKDPAILPSAENERLYSHLLEKCQSGSMRYRASDDLPFGQSWNTSANYAAGWSAVIWACKTVRGLQIARSYEVPFANANGAVVTPDTCRALGRDTALVWREFFMGKDLPDCVDGVYPHLAFVNTEDECGTGAVMPWAGRLWAVTYGPHCPAGSSDRLYEITPDLKQTIRRESVGGTPANRMIHRESNQLLIGPYVIDAEGKVRVVPPEKMPGRLTGAAEHLTDPGKVYVATMETGLYELDMRTLEVNTLIRENGMNDRSIGKLLDRLGMPWPKGWDTAPRTRVPGYHSKGLASGFGKVFISNNGENSNEARKNPFVPSGVLAWWNEPGKDWTVIRRCQFTEVKRLDNGNIVALGWDAKSVILALTEDGTNWTYFRMPKGSHTYDGAHGWNTEWPRILDAGLGGNDWLATMHGTFWRFPKDFSVAKPDGIRPLSTYLKVIGDFCYWQDAPNGGAIVFGCDDHARSEFLGKRKLKADQPKRVRSVSNLWFVKPEDLTKFGPPSGEGWVWLKEDVKAGEMSDPFLYAGYESMEFSCTDGQGHPAKTDLVKEGDWVRVKALEDIKGAHAHFVYGPPKTDLTGLLAAVKKNGFVEFTDDRGVVRRFPNVNGDRTIICREVATERDLLYVGGVFYEVPAENAGGFDVLRPISLADEPVRSISADYGLVFINGQPMVLDSLWKNGTAPKAYWLWRTFISGGLVDSSAAGAAK